MEQGIEQPPCSPFDSALQGWILGSQAFADRLRNLLTGDQAQPEIPADRVLRRVDLTLVWEATQEHYDLNAEALSQRGQHTEARAVAAWLAKRHTSATLRELATPLGLGRAQSVGNLTRRIDQARSKSRTLRRTIAQIESEITEHLSQRPRPPQKKKK